MGTGKRMDDSEVAAWNTMRRQENELAALRERVAEAEGLLRRGFAGSRHTHIVIGWESGSAMSKRG